MCKPVTSVYLGGPIDLANPDVVKRRNDLVSMLSRSGITVYNPTKAFAYGGDAERTIKNINDYAISQCDVVLLIFDADSISIGTPIEMEIASKFDKILLVVSPWEKHPVYIKALADVVFRNPIHACHYIIKNMNGVVS